MCFLCWRFDSIWKCQLLSCDLWYNRIYWNKCDEWWGDMTYPTKTKCVWTFSHYFFNLYASRNAEFTLPNAQHKFSLRTETFPWTSLLYVLNQNFWFLPQIEIGRNFRKFGANFWKSILPLCYSNRLLHLWRPNMYTLHHLEHHHHIHHFNQGAPIKERENLPVLFKQIKWKTLCQLCSH